MWNLCFVFHASSSLEAFEPVVRKCGRILKAAEVSRALWIVSFLSESSGVGN
jgi:hypothetical protein